MAMVSGVEQARDCYLRRAWREACDGFLAHDPDLEPDDLERFAVSAYLLGRTAESDDAWIRVHRIRLDQGDLVGAVRCAFWLGFRLVNAFDRSAANGWLARIERLVVETSTDSLERARLTYLTGCARPWTASSRRRSRTWVRRPTSPSGVAMTSSRRLPGSPWVVF